MRHDNLPTLLGASGALHPARRDLARIERAVQRDVTVARARAHVIAERGRANVDALGDVAQDAMECGARVSAHAARLANACPVAEPMLRDILNTAVAPALARAVNDAARDLR